MISVSTIFYGKSFDIGLLIAEDAERQNESTVGSETGDALDGTRENKVLRIEALIYFFLHLVTTLMIISRTLQGPLGSNTKAEHVIALVISVALAVHSLTKRQRESGSSAASLSDLFSFNMMAFVVVNWRQIFDFTGGIKDASGAMTWPWIVIIALAILFYYVASRKRNVFVLWLSFLLFILATLHIIWGIEDLNLFAINNASWSAIFVCFALMSLVWFIVAKISNIVDSFSFDRSLAWSTVWLLLFVAILVFNPNVLLKSSQLFMNQPTRWINNGLPLPWALVLVTIAIAGALVLLFIFKSTGVHQYSVCVLLICGFLVILLRQLKLGNTLSLIGSLLFTAIYVAQLLEAEYNADLYLKPLPNYVFLIILGISAWIVLEALVAGAWIAVAISILFFHVVIMCVQMDLQAFVSKIMITWMFILCIVLVIWRQETGLHLLVPVGVYAASFLALHSSLKFNQFERHKGHIVSACIIIALCAGLLLSYVHTIVF